ncbi:hypothetical protein ACLB2K_016709 [Fragaria x ananassa]
MRLLFFLPRSPRICSQFDQPAPRQVPLLGHPASTSSPVRALPTRSPVSDVLSKKPSFSRGLLYCPPECASIPYTITKGSFINLTTLVQKKSKECIIETQVCGVQESKQP